jgi:LPXTG-site transpeptidase (sortase) family protein
MVKTISIILLIIGTGLWIGIGATVIVNRKIIKTVAFQNPPFKNLTIGTNINNTDGNSVKSESGSGIPKNIKIPAIAVDAAVEIVGLDPQNRMDVPKRWENVAWYNLGYKVGDNGSAVLSGHLDTSSGAPAVFFDLDNLKPGDEITVTDTTSKSYKYRVYEKKTYPYDELPLKQIFGTAGKKGLNLITCSGFWDRNTKNYTQRVIVYAELI